MKYEYVYETSALTIKIKQDDITKQAVAAFGFCLLAIGCLTVGRWPQAQNRLAQ